MRMKSQTDCHRRTVHLGFAAILSLTSCLPCYSQNFWEPVNRPWEGTINSLVAQNGAVYAGAYYGGVFYTIDNGQTWNAKPSFLTNYDDFLQGMAVNSGGDVTVVCMSITVINDQVRLIHSVKRLPAGAASWTDISGSLATQLTSPATAITYNAAGDLLYSHNSALYRMAAGSNTWVQISSVTNAITCFARDANGRLYAG